MKNVLFSILAILITMGSMANDKLNQDEKQAVKAVKAFVSNADSQNAAMIKNVLHDSFRAVVNRVFGSKEVSVIDKSTYISLIEAKKIGGDQRKVTIESVKVNGTTAVVHAVLDGKKMTFNTFIQLIKEASGEWKVISDMPQITMKG